MDDTLERPPPRWAHALSRFNRWMMFDIGGGPRPFRLATIINLQKAGTFPVIALLMWYYSGKTPAAAFAALCLGGALRRASPCGLALPRKAWGCLSGAPR